MRFLWLTISRRFDSVIGELRSDSDVDPNSRSRGVSVPASRVWLDYQPWWYYVTTGRSCRAFDMSPVAASG
jgi:hypothetical protein